MSFHGERVQRIVVSAVGPDGKRYAVKAEINSRPSADLNELRRDRIRARDAIAAGLGDFEYPIDSPIYTKHRVTLKEVIDIPPVF